MTHASLCSLYSDVFRNKVVVISVDVICIDKESVCWGNFRCYMQHQITLTSILDAFSQSNEFSKTYQMSLQRKKVKLARKIGRDRNLKVVQFEFSALVSAMRCLPISFVRLIFNQIKLPFLFCRYDSGFSRYNSGFSRYNSGFSRYNSGFHGTIPGFKGTFPGFKVQFRVFKVQFRFFKKTREI